MGSIPIRVAKQFCGAIVRKHANSRESRNSVLRYLDKRQRVVLINATHSKLLEAQRDALLMLGCSDTQTAYVFNRRLVSPASRFCVELVALAENKGVITADQHAEYLKACAQAGYCSRSVYVDAKEYDTQLLPDIVRNRMFFRRAFLDGIGYDDYRVMTTVAGGAYSNTVSGLLRYEVSNVQTSVNGITVVCAEETGQISRRESDALLVAHFYLLLEQLTDPLWVRTTFERGWRMRAQRWEVERAIYEYKADQAAEEVEKIRSSHD